jgi:tRNA(Ile)-lysidine synthase
VSSGQATRTAIEARVAKKVAEHRLWPMGAALVVAVSGGADSLCLLGTLLALRESGSPQAPGRLVVAHLDHGLRGEEGAADAAWVAELAASLGVPCVAERVDMAELARAERRSLEDAARRARYAFLRRVAAQEGAIRICTGHTRDDQAETIVHHFLRGSGLAGLAGMPWLEDDLARPLLDLTHEQTAAYCAARGWQPREDPTNRDLRFTRNRIRHELLPLLETYNPNLRATLARNAALLAADERHLEAQADAAWEACLVSAGSGPLAFSRAALRGQPPALLHRLFRRALRTLGADERWLEARHILLLERLLAAGKTGAGLDLPDRVRAELGYETLAFAQSPAAQREPAAQTDERGVPLPVPGVAELSEAGWRIRAWHIEQPAGVGDVALPPPDEHPAFAYKGLDAQREQAEMRAYLDAEQAGTNLWVRTWRRGDRFRPLGMRHEKKLQDFFADAKVPRELRSRLPLVVGRDHPLWVAGLRIDDRARLSAATRRILVLQLEPTDSSSASDGGAATG